MKLTSAEPVHDPKLAAIYAELLRCYAVLDRIVKNIRELDKEQRQ